MESRYRILPHTADGKFQAFGLTLEEAFSNAALATASFMWDWSGVEPRVRYPVRVRGGDLPQLLVKFLGEVIYLLEMKSFLLGGVDGLTINRSGGRFELVADFWGDEASGGYDIHGDVKAVTYNEMKIEECGGFTIQVVVDM